MGLITPMVIMIARSLLGLEAGFNGLIVGVEVADVGSAKSHLVFAPRKQSNPGDRTRTALMAFGVSPIPRIRHMTKIVQSVVKFVAVDVVDVFRPIAAGHTPYDAMSQHQLVENGPLKVTADCNVSEGPAAREFTVPHFRVGRRAMQAAVFEPMHATLAPRQNAAGSIIFKKLFKNFAGKVGFSHWGLSERSLWSGLVEWWNTPQARIYTPSCRANAMREV